MAIPELFSITLPLLKCLSDDKPRTSNEIYEYLSDYFNVTDKEKEELLKSGTPRFTNRIAWAKAELKMAKLMKTPERGVYQITERGKEVLNDNPDRLDRNYFKQFDEYRNKLDKDDKEEKKKSKIELDTITPLEEIENAYQEIHDKLGKEIINAISECSPQFFEKLVIQLLVRMGYGGSFEDAAKAVGKTGDEGIDGVIKEDKLGLDTVFIQAKRWKNTVGRPEIQAFAGALMGKRSKKGIFITTSSFSKSAEDYAKSIETKIVLIDGEQLAQYMIDYDLGVSKISSYDIKKIDTDYFIEQP